MSASHFSPEPRMFRAVADQMDHLRGRLQDQNPCAPQGHFGGKAFALWRNPSRGAWGFGWSRQWSSSLTPSLARRKPTSPARTRNVSSQCGRYGKVREALRKTPGSRGSSEHDSNTVLPQEHRCRQTGVHSGTDRTERRPHGPSTGCTRSRRPEAHASPPPSHGSAPVNAAA